jgi:RimJ/RimL family protein N-acetyltransferase
MNSVDPDRKVRLRRIQIADAAIIETWPPYPPELTELDYALRNSGWITEFSTQPDTWIYVAEQSNELIAFTILSLTAQGEAEFRIALRADKLGHGLGRIISEQALAIGFDEIGLERIHLIVRKNNQRARALYQGLNFSHCGESQILVNGKQVDFLAMELFAGGFIRPMSANE